MSDIEAQIEACLRRHAALTDTAMPRLSDIRQRSRELARRRNTVAALGTATAIPAVTVGVIGTASWLGSSTTPLHIATIASASSTASPSPTSSQPTPNPQPCRDRQGLFVHLNEKNKMVTGDGGIDGALAKLFVEVLNNERYSGPDTADPPTYDGARYVVGFPDDSKTEIDAYVLRVNPDGSWAAERQFQEVNCASS
jgi:hypothetical protein